MDKLQWFKFTPTDWIMGKIQKCPEITQARFMRLICLYWNKDCILSIEDAEIEIDKEHLDILFSKKTIKVIDGFISIDFLNEQFEEILKLSQKRRDSVLQRWAKAKQTDTNVLNNDTSVLQNDTEKEKELYLDKDLEKREDLELENNKGVSDLKNPTPPPKIDYEKLKLFFNENSGVMSKIQILSDKRKKAISSLIKKFSKEDFILVIEKSKESNFLQGQNDRNWKADFDWILNQTNFIKILEGNYDNNTQKNSSNGKQQQFTSNSKKPARFSIARAEQTLRSDAERKQREMEERNSRG